MHSDVGLFPWTFPRTFFNVKVVVSGGNIQGETHLGGNLWILRTQLALDRDPKGRNLVSQETKKWVKIQRLFLAHLGTAVKSWADVRRPSCRWSSLVAGGAVKSSRDWDASSLHRRQSPTPDSAGRELLRTYRQRQRLVRLRWLLSAFERAHVLP